MNNIIILINFINDQLKQYANNKMLEANGTTSMGREKPISNMPENKPGIIKDLPREEDTKAMLPGGRNPDSPLVSNEMPGMSEPTIGKRMW